MMSERNSPCPNFPISAQRSVVDLPLKVIRQARFSGSWHIAREDIVRNIVATLQSEIKVPLLFDRSLPAMLARRNAYSRWLAVSIGLLNGLRPAEVVRTLVRYVDIDDCWLSVRGKPHRTRLACRRVPLLPEFVPHFQTLIDFRKPSQGGHLLGLYDKAGRWSECTTKDLNEILTIACASFGMNAAPDFYSLRHRFRSDLLDLGMPEHLLYYLLGHESRGVESRNIYLERTLDDLVPWYRKCARRLAETYGFFLEQVA